MFDLYFDRRVGDVFMLDPERLIPPDPAAPWLFRKTSDGWTHARRLELARADLESLQRGERPAHELLTAAPVLTDWRIVPVAGSLALQGTVAGHPDIGEARFVRTSALIALDAAGQRWARTVSRFYLLDRRRKGG